MKAKAKAKQPSPDEILTDYFASHRLDEIFVDCDADCLTDDGKAVLALGLLVYKGFNSAKR